MKEVDLINLQDDGTATTVHQANQALYAAKSKIPAEYRSKFYTSIRFQHDCYVWYLMLK